MIITTLLLLPLLFAVGLGFVTSPFKIKTLFLMSTILTALGAFFSAGDAVVCSWIPALGIQFKLGVDGLSWVMLLLTSGTFLAVALASWTSGAPHSPWFYLSLLVTQSALIGVFTAQDLFLFYTFWELAILPAFFMMMGWGGEGKGAATIKFLLYSLAGSFCLLVALLYLYVQSPTHSFDMQALSQIHLVPLAQFFVFGLLFLAFAIKTPLFPLHTWQPGAYFKSPFLTTMVLAGVLSKMGIYGMLRLLPLFPLGFSRFAEPLLILVIIGMLYASSVALAQHHMKRLIAYSSIAHMGLIVAGILTMTTQGIQGSVLQMVAHAVSVLGLLYVAQLIYSRTGTLEMFQLGGLRTASPLLAGSFLVIVLGSIGVPLTSGFVGECLLLFSLFEVHPIFSVLAGFCLILSAWYMLKLVQHVMLGKPMHPEKSVDLSLSFVEKVALGAFVVAILAIGIFPHYILQAVSTFTTHALASGALL